jgi:hypothetical protein
MNETTKRLYEYPVSRLPVQPYQKLGISVDVKAGSAPL